MLRTRDFVLFVLGIGFLVLAIGSTVSVQKPAPSDETVMRFAETDEVDFEAEIVEQEALSREERLLAMRQKVAESEDVFFTEDNQLTIDGEPGDAEVIVVEDFDEIEVPGPRMCESFSRYQGDWVASAVNVKEVEGVRIFYTEEVVETLVASTTGSTTEQVLVAERQEVPVLRLPIQPLLSSQNNCINSDVIGVATDGSLIRNQDYTLYSIFDETTRIGIALDGWPIYGSTSRELDECGGAGSQADYAYYLGGTELLRSDVLNCFASNPVAF